MKEKIGKIVINLGRREFLLLLVFTVAAYFLIEFTGLFRLEPASVREVFHSMPVKALSVLFAINALAGMIWGLRQSRGWMRAGGGIFYLSILVLVGGLWTSVYTRFEGSFARAEGQTFTAFKSDYIQDTLYLPDERRLPQLGFTFHRIRPEASKDMKRIERISADVSYSSRTANKIIDKTITSDYPLISDWTIARFSDFGYRIKFALYDLNEKELESNYYFMKLFPPGAEDYTEGMFLGYQFYIRCYPDYVDNDGKPDSISPYPKNPVFNLRIVRNKDIAYDGLLKPAEKVRFDNVVVSLPEVKMSVEMSMVRDMGLPVAAAGIILMVLGVGMMWVGGRGKTG